MNQNLIKNFASNKDTHKDGEEPEKKNTETGSVAPAPPTETGEEHKNLSPINLLFERSWKIYKENLGKLIIIMLVPILGFLPFIGLLIATGIMNVATNNIMSKIHFVWSIIFIILFLVFLAIGVMVVLIARAALFILIRDNQDNLSVKEALKKGRHYAWSYFMVDISSNFIVFFWMIFLIIPGFIFAVYYILAPWVLFYEDFESTKALKRSRELISGYWWDVLARLGVLVLVYIAIVFMPTIIITNEIFKTTWGLAANVFTLVFTPFFFIYTCLLYWDLIKIKGTETKIKSKKGHGWIMMVLLVIFLGGFFTIFSYFAMNSAKSKADDAMVISNIRQIQTSIMFYREEHDTLPANLDSLRGELGIRDETLEDKQGRKYEYHVAGNSYQLCFWLSNNYKNLYSPGYNCVSGNDKDN